MKNLSLSLALTLSLLCIQSNFAKNTSTIQEQKSSVQKILKQKNTIQALSFCFTGDIVNKANEINDEYSKVQILLERIKNLKTRLGQKQCGDAGKHYWRAVSKHLKVKLSEQLIKAVATIQREIPNYKKIKARHNVESFKHDKVCVDARTFDYNLYQAKYSTRLAAMRYNECLTN